MAPALKRAMPAKSLEQVKEYYGRVLSSKDDLKTSACCIEGSYPAYIQQIRSALPKEVIQKFYGCGSPIPPALEGLSVLDLGCGAGHDCFVVSKLVGETGRVLGVDMTEQQLSVATQAQESVAKNFGFEHSNISFRKAYIEDLKTADVADESVDLVISNCVLNLSPDKESVFREIFRVLKPSGELYFSDVFADRRVPQVLFEDQEVLGECLGGALYFEDFRRLMTEMGCPDVRTLDSSMIQISNPGIKSKTGEINFYSATVRAFKLSTLEDRCEDFGQVATYKGGVDECPQAFVLDDHHRFVKDKPMLVCGNTTAMLEETRFGKFFEITGDKKTHFGLFDCGLSPLSGLKSESSSTPGACC